jgi:hypothetical protein
MGLTNGSEPLLAFWALTAIVLTHKARKRT